ncbi:hypothetical protein CVT24_000466 [Panaeolus cyanescens]|uniref:Uncharacterized protein n=1 Tax=Panaeolus cyanescens TaxID=181874 RepID=A0A409V8C8_9AGAR|nr:hypothetical protein CVT24_000466 [Panaeolus cyanescens]
MCVTVQSAPNLARPLEARQGEIVVLSPPPTTSGRRRFRIIDLEDQTSFFQIQLNGDFTLFEATPGTAPFEKFTARLQSAQQKLQRLLNNGSLDDPEPLSTASPIPLPTSTSSPLPPTSLPSETLTPTGGAETTEVLTVPSSSSSDPFTVTSDPPPTSTSVAVVVVISDATTQAQDVTVPVTVLPSDTISPSTQIVTTEAPAPTPDVPTSTLLSSSVVISPGNSAPPPRSTVTIDAASTPPPSSSRTSASSPDTASTAAFPAQTSAAAPEATISRAETTSQIFTRPGVSGSSR